MNESTQTKLLESVSGRFFWENRNGGSQTGAYKPQIKEKIGKEIIPGKSGLFGANWGLSRANRGLFGGRLGPIPPHLTPTGEKQKLPQKALLGPIGAFRAKPPFAKPLLDSPSFGKRTSNSSCKNMTILLEGKNVAYWSGLKPAICKCDFHHGPRNGAGGMTAHCNVSQFSHAPC